jgi:hypothetical protein
LNEVDGAANCDDAISIWKVNRRITAAAKDRGATSLLFMVAYLLV